MQKLRSGFQWFGVLAAVLVFSPGSVLAGQRFTGELVRIVDGDTAHVIDDDGIRHKVRFLGMDTPELNFNGKAQLPWAQTATDRLHELVNATQAGVNKGGQITKSCVDRTTGKPVVVDVELAGQDIHRRDLGYILYKGVNLNLQLVEEGLAHPYLYCAKGDCDKKWPKRAMVSEFLEACKQAQKNKAGFWGEKKKVLAPSEFRRQVDRGRRYQFIANYDSKELFKPNDFDKVDDCSQIRFQYEADAQMLGYDY